MNNQSNKFMDSINTGLNFEEDRNGRIYLGARSFTTLIHNTNDHKSRDWAKDRQRDFLLRMIDGLDGLTDSTDILRIVIFSENDNYDDMIIISQDDGGISQEDINNIINIDNIDVADDGNGYHSSISAFVDVDNYDRVAEFNIKSYIEKLKNSNKFNDQLKKLGTISIENYIDEGNQWVVKLSSGNSMNGFININNTNMVDLVENDFERQVNRLLKAGLDLREDGPYLKLKEK